MKFYEPGYQFIPIPHSLSHIAVSLLAHRSGSMWRTWASVTGTRQNDEIVRAHRPWLGLRWEGPSVLHLQMSESAPLLYLLPLQGTTAKKDLNTTVSNEKHKIIRANSDWHQFFGETQLCILFRSHPQN